MMLYKNNGKKGFAISTNLINRENLTAGGLTAAALAAMLLITKNKKKKNGSQEAKPQKSHKRSKKSKPKSKGLFKLLIIPALMKAAKFAVTQGKLHSLVNKVRSGEGLNADAFSQAPAEGEPQKDNEPVTVCGMEIIEPIDIISEEEVYEHI